MPTISDNNWGKTLEAIEEHLRNHLGETKILLACVFCRKSYLPDHSTDLATNYPLDQDEMIARAPHVNGAGDVDTVYELDHRHVWTIMADLC